MKKPSPQLLRLLGGQPLSSEEIVAHLQKLERCHPEDFNYAKLLTRAEVRYLRSSQIHQIIEATLPEASAVEAAALNKQIASRIGALLPSIIALLRKQDDDTVSYVINRLFDTAEDFSTEPVDTRRVDKVRNDRLRLLDKSMATLKNAVTALTEVDREVWEFATEVSTLMLASGASAGQNDRFREGPADPVDALIASLNTAIMATRVLFYDLKGAKPRNPPKSYTMSKGNIVSLCYDLHFQCEGPPLKTTPGSDFSFLASLLYEATTGRPEESLAGAVIDFARGQSRLAEDSYQREQNGDEEAHANGDNFHHQKSGRLSDHNAANWYREASEAFGPDDPARSVLTSVADALELSATMREQKFGPFMVWAEHLPDWRDGTITRESTERAEELRAMRRKLGDLRRKAAAAGLADFE